MKINLDCYYYFWDKKLKKIGELFVIKKEEKTFCFLYDGRRYRATFDNAEGKIYNSYTQIPEYQSALREKPTYADYIEDQFHKDYPNTHDTIYTRGRNLREEEQAWGRNFEDNKVRWREDLD